MAAGGSPTTKVRRPSRGRGESHGESSSGKDPFPLKKNIYFNSKIDTEIQRHLQQQKLLENI
jgi:hypothetical protein